MPLVTIDDIHSAARIVYAHMGTTPQSSWPMLDRKYGAEVWIKQENHTPSASFHLRGALVHLTRIRERLADVRGIMAAGRGGQGLSLAWAAARLGIGASIVLPEDRKDEATALSALGAEVIMAGRDFDSAYAYAMTEAESRGLHPVRSFHPELVMGAGTAALELFRAVKDLDAVYVPLGQGTAISAMIEVRDAMGLKTEIFGVVAANAPCYALSFKKRKPVQTEGAATLARELACRVPDGLALAGIVAGASGVVQVSEQEILAAISVLATHAHSLADGAGAAPLAALIKESQAIQGRRVAIFQSGGNIDRETLALALQTEEPKASAGECTPDEPASCPGFDPDSSRCSDCVEGGKGAS